jgi:hypothetical protein
LILRPSWHRCDCWERFIQNSDTLDEAIVAALQRLAELGLVDAGHEETAPGKPFIWVSNANGERRAEAPRRAGRHPLKIHPPQTALAALPDTDRETVLATVEVLQGRDPATWLPEQVERVSPDNPAYW